jgi:sugar lactone lactonase YvrE
MGLDERLTEALERSAGGVDADPVEALRSVRAGAAHRVSRARRRRLVIVVSVAAAGVAVVALLVGGGRLHDLGGPQPSRHGPAPDPFRIVHTYPAAGLGLTHLLGMAASPNGDLYVTDRSGMVAEVTPRGTVVRRWGSEGQRPGQFRFDIGSIAVDRRGRVYVSDTGNARIQVFSPRGRYLESLGSFGHAEGQFLWPFDVAVDQHGDVYVSDDRAQTVTKLAPDGAPLWRVGGGDQAPRAFVGHFHFQDFDAHGRLVTTNDDQGLVRYLRPDGTIDGGFGTPSSGGEEFLNITGKGEFPDGACDATVDPQGLIYVTSCQDRTWPRHSTRVFDTSGRLTGLWSRDPLARSPVFTGESTAYAVTYDGNLVELHVDH